MNLKQKIDKVLTEYNFDRMSFDEAKKELLSLQADIRNKLSPVANLVALLEDNAPQKYIDAEIEAVKKSIEYLSNYR